MSLSLQNVVPEHLSGIIIYIDALTIVFEETSKGGSATGNNKPLSLPIASIDAGDGYGLPNLALRYVLRFLLDTGNAK
jgi:hypothetical protein